MRKTGGHHVGWEVADQNCKLPSQLRNIVKDTKWYGVKAMDLTACSNILGNIINALERILNLQRAINFNINYTNSSPSATAHFFVSWYFCQLVWQPSKREPVLSYDNAFKQKLVDFIIMFCCLWHNGHTLVNFGWMYLHDFYTIFRKCPLSTYFLII